MFNLCRRFFYTEFTKSISLRENKFAQKINAEAHAEGNRAGAQAVFIVVAVRIPRFIGDDACRISADELREIHDSFACFRARRIAGDEDVFEAFAEAFLPAALETIVEFERFGDAERDGVANGVGCIARCEPFAEAARCFSPFGRLVGDLPERRADGRAD